MNNDNGTMHWIAVLKKAVEDLDPVEDSGREGALEWLIWACFWFGFGAVLTWWATS